MEQEQKNMQSTDNVTLNRLLTTVARQGASDLHLTVGAPPVLRKEGELFQLENEQIVTAHFLERIIYSFTNEQEKKFLEDEKEVTLTKTFNKIQRFRVTVYKQKGYNSISFRYIPATNQKIADLKLPQYLEQIVRFSSGLIIICGGYDSGKTSSATAVINTLNELGPPRYITTLEKPVEYLFANNKCIIEQREVGKDVVSYNQGLKLVLDGDIDMVFIDHISDQKAAKKFFEVLEAGRSVLLTVTSSSSLNSLSKLMSFVNPPERIWVQKVLANHLECVLMQKLVHRIGGGRVLAYEFVVNTGMTPSFLSSGSFERIDTVIKTVKENGMTALEESLAQLVQNGEIKMEVALMEANDKNYLKRLIR